MERLGTLTVVALMLTFVGALNWGLIGFFDWNLVDAVFGGGAREETSAFSRVIYALVGLAGLVSLFLLPRLREQAGELDLSLRRFYHADDDASRREKEQALEQELKKKFPVTVDDAALAKMPMPPPNTAAPGPMMKPDMRMMPTLGAPRLPMTPPPAPPPPAPPKAPQ